MFIAYFHLILVKLYLICSLLSDVCNICYCGKDLIWFYDTSSKLLVDHSHHVLVKSTGIFFLLFYFELLSWSIFWDVCLMLFIVTALSLVVVEMLWEHFYHWLIPLHMDTDRRVSFDWWIIEFCNVQFYQPCHFWNHLFQMLVDYWYDLPIVGSVMEQSLHIFYRYLVFCAKFWVFHWKFRMRVCCRSRGKEVYWRWLFCCLLLKSLFHNWDVERGHKLVWVDSNVQLCYRDWLWGRRRWWFRTQCIGDKGE